MATTERGFGFVCLCLFFWFGLVWFGGSGWYDNLPLPLTCNCERVIDLSLLDFFDFLLVEQTKNKRLPSFCF